MPSLAATDPYPWPYDGDLSPARLALVICGAQRHWAKVCGERAGPVIASLAGLVGPLGQTGALVVALRHGGRQTPTGSPGWPLIDAIHADLTVDSAGFDGCYGSCLEHELRRRGRDHLLLAGLASELTVDSSLRSLNDRGFECLVLSDLCCPVEVDLGARALHSTTMSGGIFGAIGTSHGILEGLVQE